mmetsp:Transcript_56111/g.121393  ORF Transcript_56111/g.121393 Transcript_56111/m.121393 type:complete len:270 (+) Transcript_56111:579-1388(+)
MKVPRRWLRISPRRHLLDEGQERGDVIPADILEDLRTGSSPLDGNLCRRSCNICASSTVEAQARDGLRRDEERRSGQEAQAHPQGVESAFDNAAICSNPAQRTDVAFRLAKLKTEAFCKEPGQNHILCLFASNGERSFGGQVVSHRARLEFDPSSSRDVVARKGLRPVCVHHEASQSLLAHSQGLPQDEDDVEGLRRGFPSRAAEALYLRQAEHVGDVTPKHWPMDGGAGAGIRGPEKKSGTTQDHFESASRNLYREAAQREQLLAGIA